MKEISLKDIGGFSIGHAQDDVAKTGATVVYFKDGAHVGVDISGGGPASRETPLASPLTADNLVNAIVLAGGSAFGLAASDGVMTCLEEHQIGYDTGFAKVPLVLQSSIYDLGYGLSEVRPSAKMGYEACLNALNSYDERIGNIGGGTGASVGKLCGMGQAMKAGIGTYALQVGELKIGAIVIVNALGDIFDPTTGKIIAGLMNKERTAMINLEDLMIEMLSTPTDLFHSNTTIGCVICNSAFDKASLNKIASMARNAYARCINPVGTLADGDSIYACSVGDVKSDINVVGTLAAKVMTKAIINAIEASKIDDETFLSHCVGVD